MARTLERLQAQYHSTRKDQKRPMMGPGPGGPRGRMGGPRGKGKPKNAKATVARLLSYIGKDAYLLIVVLGCMLLNTVFSLCGSFMIAPLINRITEIVAPEAEIVKSAPELAAEKIVDAFSSTAFFQKFATSSMAEIKIYVLAGLCILAMIYLFAVATSYLQSRLMLRVSQRSVEKIRNDLFTRMQKLPVRYFDAHPTGELMSRFTNDIDNVDMMLNNSLTSIISGSVTLVGTLAFMIGINWKLTLVTLAFIPVFLFGAGKVGRMSGAHYAGQQAALGAVNGYIEETITGQKVIKVFNHEGDCNEEFELLNEDLRNKQFLASFFGGIMGPVMGNLSQVAYSVTIGVGGILMCLTGMTPGALTVFAGYSKQFARPIDMISMQMSTIFAALAGAERVFAVMDETPEACDDEHASERAIFGDVRFENVTFGYTPDKTVLSDISLYAHPGQKIAFVGSTGAGKTTITNLLNRFYDIEEGSITIDGTPITGFSREHLRHNIAMVLQDTHLFTGTVRENIRYGRLDATDDEVVAAAKTASAHSFIMRLENGYDTVLEGDGANLSQGQRQLLNIARAALSKAPILVLDEATSSVDTRTERHIERGMDRLMQDRTTFVIAHRLSTVRNANAIMVLERGEIIERGTHDDLLALGGRYYELYTGKRELD